MGELKRVKGIVKEIIIHLSKASNRPVYRFGLRIKGSETLRDEVGKDNRFLLPIETRYLQHEPTILQINHRQMKIESKRLKDLRLTCHVPYLRKRRFT